MMKAKRAMLSVLLAAAAMTLAGTARAETPTASNAEWRGMVETMYQGMDANRDGMVSRTEFLKEMGKRFDKMDRAKKGTVDMKSIETILSELAMRTGPGL
jgi:hypothetical protein